MQAVISEKFVSGQTINSNPAYPIKNLRKIIGFSFAFWTLPVIYRCLQSYFAHIVLDLPPRPFFILSFILADWYYWAIITPIVFWLGSRFPFEDIKTIRNLMIHLPIAMLVAIIHVFLLTIFFYLGSSESHSQQF
jgi:hypothetical protein